MKPQVSILSLLLLIFWLQLSAQKVDLTLKFNPSNAEYEVYAKPDFTKGEFLIAPSSQVTILIPEEFLDKPLMTSSIAGGQWNDQSPIYAPECFPTRDFHTFVSTGGSIDFRSGEPQRLFSFPLPINYDSKAIRLYAKGFDPLPSSKGMQGRNLANYIANDISLTDFYRDNYGIAKTLRGHVKDWRGFPLEAVAIKVGNQSKTSLYDGRFEFEKVSIGNDVYFYFDKKIDPLAGISTADVIALQQHLSGEHKFDQTYQWIAADVNQSGTVTQEDLSFLQKIIAQPTSPLAKTIGWTYIPADWLRTGVLYPEAYGQKVKVSYAERDFAVDFAAIKIGDINGSYTVKPYIPTNIQPSAKSLTMNLLNIKMQQGESYTIPFSAAELKEVTGYQLTLKTKDAQIDEIALGVEDKSNPILKQINPQTARVNWLRMDNSATMAKLISLKDKNSSASHQSDIPLFYLTMTPNKDGLLSDFLSMIDDTTPTEAYDENGQVMKIQLLFQLAPEEEEAFALYQNRPNPFREYTNIGYYLPDNSLVTLTLTDEEGTVLKTLKEDGKKGFNTFSLEGKEIEKGLIYFKIESSFGSETKKMLHLN